MLSFITPFFIHLFSFLKRIKWNEVELCVHSILVHISRVNLEILGTRVETVRYSLVNWNGKDSTKSVYSTISSLLQSTVCLLGGTNVTNCPPNINADYIKVHFTYNWYSKFECPWPTITDTECQLWAQMLRSTFLELILWRGKMAIK